MAELEAKRKESSAPAVNAMIESGFKAREVYRFCLANGHCPLRFGLNDEDGMPLLHLDPDRLSRRSGAKTDLSRRSFEAKMDGRVSYFWKQVRRDNRLGDCELMIIVAAVITKTLQVKLNRQ